MTVHTAPADSTRPVGRPRQGPTATPEFKELVNHLIIKHNGNYEKLNEELQAADPSLAFSSRRSYYRQLKQMNIAGPRKGGLQGDALHKAIKALPGEDASRGFRGVHHALVLSGVLATQIAVAKAQHEIDPDGVAARQLQSKKRFFRSPIVTAGPNEQWSVDGHDKLAAYGFGIYGIRDVYSGFILALHAFPNNRKAANVHWLYLKTITECNGIPIQIAADCGSETGLMLQSQVQLREQLGGPGLQETPAYVLLPSTRNITIERAWIGVRNDVVRRFQKKFDEGLGAGFVPTNQVHCAVFWFIFAPLVQQALDQHRQYQNTYKVRRQKEKLNPSGARRCEIYQTPTRWAGQQCMLQLDAEAKEETAVALREAETEADLSWIRRDVRELCLQVLREKGEQEAQISIDRAWDVFTMILPVVRDHLG